TREIAHVHPSLFANARHYTLGCSPALVAHAPRSFDRFGWSCLLKDAAELTCHLPKPLVACLPGEGADGASAGSVRARGGPLLTAAAEPDDWTSGRPGPNRRPPQPARRPARDAH